MKLTRKKYEKDLLRLQAELCNLQDWIKYKGLRVIVIFEGRDAAGKGGTIRAGEGFKDLYGSETPYSILGNVVFTY